MRSFWALILVIGFLVATSFAYAQEAPNLQGFSWTWAEKGMSVNYSFGQTDKAIAKIILTENNFGYQTTRESCHFCVPFIYQIKGNLLYAVLPGRNEAQVSQISFTPEHKLQTQEVEYFVKTSSAISGEREERLLGTPQFLEKVKN